MNAAIEAAHAGASGKDFTLKTSEVRTLAESSSVSKLKRSMHLKELNRRIHQSVALSDTASCSLGIIKDNIKQNNQVITEIA